MFGYRIELTPDDNGTFLVTCPQLPIVATFGDSVETAKRHAVDAIETALDSMIDDGEDIPRPTGGNGSGYRPLRFAGPERRGRRLSARGGDLA